MQETKVGVFMNTNSV